MVLFLLQFILQAIKPFECPICCNRFSSSYNLEYHKRGKHGLGDPFVCSCGKIFTSPAMLSLHRKKFKHPKAVKVQIAAALASRTTTTSDEKAVDYGGNFLEVNISPNLDESKSTGGTVNTNTSYDQSEISDTAQNVQVDADMSYTQDSDNSIEPSDELQLNRRKSPRQITAVNYEQLLKFQDEELSKGENEGHGEEGLPSSDW